MISISHWGMFSHPLPMLVVPKLLPDDEARLREALRQPGHIIYAGKDVDLHQVAFIQRAADEF